MSIRVVTGGTSGIGAAVAQASRDRGFDVVTVARSNADVNADLSSTAGRQTAISSLLELADAGGGIGSLILAAGGYFVDSVPAMISVNYFGVTELLSSLSPALVSGASAVVIGSASTTFIPDVPQDLVNACLEGDEVLCRAIPARLEGMVPARCYAASKLALAYFVRERAPADEWAGSGHRLNYVAFGPTDTRMLEALYADREVGEMISSLPIPVGTRLSSQEASAVVLFLCSDQSRHIVGSTVFADGGLDAMFRPRDWPAPLSTRES